MILSSECTSPNDSNLALKLGGEPLPLCHNLKERVIVVGVNCTVPVLRMLLMQEVLAELSEDFGEEKT